LRLTILPLPGIYDEFASVRYYGSLRGSVLSDRWLRFVAACAVARSGYADVCGVGKKMMPAVETQLMACAVTAALTGGCTRSACTVAVEMSVSRQW